MERKTIISILIIVASIWIFFSFTNKNLKEAEKIRSEQISYLEQEKASYVEIQSIYDEKLKEYEASITKDLEEEIDKQIIPSFIDNIRFLIAMNRLLKFHNLSEDEVAFSIDGSSSPNRSEGQKQIKEFNFSFSFATSYFGLKEVLKDIELSKKIIEIQSLSITPQEDGQTYLLSFSLKTFWY